MTLVNNLFVFFAESTDNFVSSKSALSFALKLLYSGTFGDYGFHVALFPVPRPAADPRQLRAFREL